MIDRSGSPGLIVLLYFAQYNAFPENQTFGLCWIWMGSLLGVVPYFVTAEPAENAENPWVFSAISALSAVNSISNTLGGDYLDLHPLDFFSSCFWLKHSYYSAMAFDSETVRPSVEGSEIPA